MKLAVVGATGLVGTEMLKVLAERHFQLDELLPVASARSVGQLVEYQGRQFPVVSMEDALAAAPDIAIFSAGGSVSKEFAPQFAAIGTTVIDNSSAWRMDPSKKLVVPELNAQELTAQDKIIANPNCSTIQMVVALNELHQRYKVRRIVVSTYQSVTGTGKKAVDQLMQERAGQPASAPAYPHPIDLNVLPHIDVFEPNGYTKEEMKMVNETRKIMGDDSIRVTATCVRIPVMGGHSEAINVEFAEEFDEAEVLEILRRTPGVELVDDVAQNRYPMPKDSRGRDAVLVGRVRRDATQPRTLNMWVVADNLRKGAATNAVQIAEYLVAMGLV
ncbi:aspartate-semialdehyde dehydrogenase [Hymenobacter sp. ASUV-10]|uniref:Aspartate-semialdehyde dehydrogenase n=1 Tax=Hymenobacter aranciens TaxID=3063996 RepID=A0ABT9B4A7_9BACT|nr:aspartate-semialdehyde dehydrogenase [Hymenobacter sp. ASUV-10]MDO7873104.1 aspartate-semialdehyde dehydrogenase [Hymenobacter sp. ASUV-10]